ncbi:MAG TPA: acyltransferase family protein [Pseudolysinimonas sp.]
MSTAPPGLTPTRAPLRHVFLRDISPGATIKPEIQALRALAVVSVVVFHFWPQLLPGGYIGVDVFFVISGYLIIGSLLREVNAAGRVHLVEFWARRARRLMPASLVTLIMVAVAVVIWVPQVYWVQFLREIGSAAAYVLNWLLAANSVDYLASQNAPSPVQHFWSLSVEEQFYIAWPIVILVVCLLARRASVAVRLRVLTIVLVVIVAASAIYSVVATSQNQASAYFFTTTRAWEFGIGGLLALVHDRVRELPRTVSAILAWLGIALILLAALTFNAETAFPGAVAWLPVVGALLVIGARLPRAAWSPAGLYRLRPVQWLGDVSYSLYLWHWPLLVIAPIALRHPIGDLSKAALLVTALALAWASRRFIEEPIRISPAIRRRGPWFSTISAVAAAALLLGGSLAWTGSLEARSAQARVEALKDIAADGSSCVGAGAFGPDRSECPRPFAVTALTDPVAAVSDIGRGVQVSDRCKQTDLGTGVVTCQLGVTDHPAHHIALIGDSHAGMLLEPLQIYAQAHDWEVTTYLKSWCIGTGVAHVAAPDNLSTAVVASCATWGAAALRQIASDPSIDTVVFSNFTRHYDLDVQGLGRPVTAGDFAAAWGTLTAAGKKVVVIRDMPDAGSTLIPQCVAQHMSVYDPCATPRSVAVTSSDPEWSAAQTTAGVTGIDLTDDFCDASTCHSVIGGLIVYFDYHHLTATFARTLSPYLGADIQKAIG